MQSVEDRATTAIPAEGITLPANLRVPAAAQGIVLFALGSSSSRHSVRNRRVADLLHRAGIATLLFDLVSLEADPPDAFNPRVRFDVSLLAQRLDHATRWTREQPELAGLPVGYFGVNNGAAAAIVAAANNPDVRAVVARGGRTDLAEDSFRTLRAPTLLIVGGNDDAVAALNLETWARLRCEKSIEIIPGAGHLFEEPGALDRVAALTTQWFSDHLQNAGARPE